MILCLIVFLVACKEKNTEKTEEKVTTVSDPADDQEAAFVEISAEQMKAVGIQTDSLQQRSLTSLLKVNGLLTVPNQNKALVTSVTNGVIKTLHVQPGSFVTRGQVIATIVNPDLAPLQQQLQITNAQIKMAQLEQARQKELIAGNAAPLKNLQRVNTELATLRATKNGLQQQLRSMGINYSGGAINTTLRVLAPISGTISEVTAQIGSNVDAANPIAQIVNNAQLHVDIFLYEKDLARVAVKQTINFSLTNLPGKEYTAEIYSIGAAFANETKTIPVHAIVKGDKTGLIDGMNITAAISTGFTKAYAVPTEAIVNNENQDIIFLLVKPDIAKGADKTAAGIAQFIKFPVTKGVSDAGFTEIIPVNPFPPDARVVTKGAFFVLAKMTNKGEEE
ncbi:MAG: efflux transporter periplasmic adaptor subunit [Ferruginibacter sp.]|nr:efflux transporter periplasmic adaptor subunit [Ferruginibacter sp.]